MERFCTNCGTKIKEDADICLGCGKYLANDEKIIKEEEKQNTNDTINKNDIIGISGLISGVISFTIIFLIASNIEDIVYSISSEDIFIIRLMFAFIITMGAYLFAIPGLILSIHSIKKEKNILSMLGLIFTLLSIILTIILILLITF